MSLEAYTEREQAAMRDLIHQANRQADAVGAFTGLIVQTTRLFGKHPFMFIETELRKIKSLMHFIAVPTSTMNPSEFKSVMPHTGETEYDYFLQYNIGSEGLWHEELQSIGITPEENVRRLPKTGMLAVRKGTELSRMSRSSYN